MSAIATLGRSRQLIVGLCVLSTMGFGAALAPWITPFEPETPYPGAWLLPPGKEFWFGTDKLGLDIFSRIIYGARTDLLVATASTSLALLLGMPLGLVAGYSNERISDLIMRPSDIFQAFPVFILALGLVVALGQSIFNIILVIGIVNAPIFVRLMRSQVLTLREEPFIEAAKAVGNPTSRLLWRHLLPHTVGPLIAQSGVTTGWAILIVAGLAFLGVGIRVPTPEWGSMVGIGAGNIITGEWWISVFPGLAIFLTVMAFNLVADGIQDLLEADHG